MILQKQYSPSIIEFADRVMKALDDIDDKDKTNFWTNLENGFEDENRAKQITYEILCEYGLERFLNNEDIMFKNEDDVVNVLNGAVVMYHLNSLKNKGFVNSYEDEQTEEVFFLTKEGKEYARNNLGISKTGSF